MIDWQTVIIAGIAAVPSTLFAAASFVQATKAKNQATETHKSVNSRMDELLKAATEKATAEATNAEKDAEQGRKLARAKVRKAR